MESLLYAGMGRVLVPLLCCPLEKILCSMCSVYTQNSCFSGMMTWHI